MSDCTGWREHGGPWRAAVITRPYRENDDGGGAISSFPMAEGRRKMAGNGEAEQGYVEAEERLAIIRESELANRQTIPQRTMLAGLLRAARWS